MQRATNMKQKIEINKINVKVEFFLPRFCFRCCLLDCSRNKISNLDLNNVMRSDMRISTEIWIPQISELYALKSEYVYLDTSVISSSIYVINGNIVELVYWNCFQIIPRCMGRPKIFQVTHTFSSFSSFFQCKILIKK